MFQEVTLTPSFGNQLGGTPVIIRGPCFAPGDIIGCNFNSTGVLGKYVNNETALCVTPTVNVVGSTDVSVRIRRRGMPMLIIKPPTTFTFGQLATSTSQLMKRVGGEIIVRR